MRSSESGSSRVPGKAGAQPSSARAALSSRAQQGGNRRALPPGMRQERAFLVGLDYRSGGRGRRMTSVVQAARDAASPSRPTSQPKFSAEESLGELRDLAISAGAEIVGEILQHRDRPDPATLIGKGKLEEIAGAAASASADLLLFDHDLTASQQRNIERVVNARIIDRTQLILDIFATHARTREGQLQVELAQLEYMLPRLAGRGIEMSQLGGGIGTRGPGETQLETDRRKINRRIRHLQQQMGYTNAGKSTLFNALTNATVLESPRMFATLDPTLRSVTLPSKRKALLSDTVGFIRNLPHTLVSSFRATLEEVQRAALILHVSDASSPLSAEQDAQVEEVLKELEVANKPTLHIKNKVDLLPSKQRDSLLDDPRTVHVSAAKGIGLTTLLDRIDQVLSEDSTSRVRLRIPQKEGKALSLIEAGSRVYSRAYKDGAVEMEAEVPESLARRVKEWLVS